MVKLAKHPKKSQRETGTGSIKQNFIKDLEPIIKKYGLENDANCKECIEWIKNNNPRGYHSLVLGLWMNESLDAKEENILFSAVKEAVENGIEEAQFCYGSLLLFGIGVKQDVEMGLNNMNKAFLKLFSKVFVQQPLGSEMSEFLYSLFKTNQVDQSSACQATTENDLVDEYQKLSNHYNTVSLASQNAISIKAIKL